MQALEPCQVQERVPGLARGRVQGPCRVQGLARAARQAPVAQSPLGRCMCTTANTATMNVKFGAKEAL